jgi:hypothetical protein
MCYPSRSLDTGNKVVTPKHLLGSDPQTKLSDCSSRRIFRPMTTPYGQELSNKVTRLEGRMDTVEKGQAIDRLWKIAIIAAVACSAVALIFVLFRVPSKHEVNERIGNLEQQRETVSKIPDEQVSSMKLDMSAMEQRWNDRMHRLEDGFGKLTERLDRYIDSKLIGSSKQLRSSYSRAVTVEPNKLAKSLPVAQDLLARAKKKGTAAQRNDIKELANITLPLLDQKYNDSKVKEEVWNTLEQLAAFSTYTKREFKGKNACKDGPGSIGGITLENVTFANCTVYYRGGDIILKNVRFINTDFEVLQDAKGRELLTALLQSNSSTISIDTSSLEPKSSE